MSLIVRVEKLDTLRTTLEKLAYQISQTLPHRILSRASKKLKNLIWFFAPERTGALRRSIRTTWTHNRVMISVDAPYAIYVEEGTRPHIIRPRTSGVLRFEKPSGEIVYTKKPVHHPGFKGRKFVERAVKQFVEEMLRDFALEVDAEIEVLTR